MAEFAHPDDVAEQAKHWTAGQLRCRTKGHDWQPLRAVHNKRLRYYDIAERCPRCDCERYAEMSESGHIYAQWIGYEASYLSTIGRIMGEGRDVLRIANVQVNFPLTTMKAAEARELPKSQAAREAVAGMDSNVTSIRRSA